MDRFKDMVITDIINISTVYSKKGHTYTAENRKSFALSFCESGSITYTVNGKNVISDKNCAVILPRHGNYSLYATKTGYFPLVDFTCENVPDLNDIISVRLKNPEFYLKEYRKLLKYDIYGMGRAKKISALYNIIDLMADETGTYNTVLQSSLDFIDQNISDPDLKNNVIARQNNISEVYLRKLFSKEISLSPKQYIILKRIGKAKELLTDKSLSVSDISSLCGFNSVYHFCKCFKLHTNTTPTDYRTKTYSDPTSLT